MQLFGYCTKEIYRLRPLCETNLPSCVARRPLCQTISKLLPSSPEQMRPALPREISGLPNHSRINAMGSVYTPVHALMNDARRCNVRQCCSFKEH